MKRAFDVIGALLGLLVLWSLIVVLMAAIKITSPGPALLAQPRVGRGGSIFTLYKLRSMYLGTPQVPTHDVKTSAVTPIGRVIRRLKLDELPQLYNVLRGEMSLVGPRPCLPSQGDLIEARRLSGALDVLPGVTGLAQVQGVDMSDVARLALIDGHYARTHSFGGDLRLIFETLAAGRESH